MVRFNYLETFLLRFRRIILKALYRLHQVPQNDGPEQNFVIKERDYISFIWKNHAEHDRSVLFQSILSLNLVLK